MTFPHGYATEFVQLGVSFVGLLLLHWALWDALRDSTVAGVEQAKEERVIIAMNNVRSEIFRILLMSLLLINAVVAVLLPPPFSYVYDVHSPEIAGLIKQIQELDPRILAEGAARTVGQTTTRWIQVIAAIILLVDSLLARRTRILFIRRVRLTVAEPSGVPAERGSDHT